MSNNYKQKITDAQLSQKLLENVNYLINKSGLNQIEIAALAKIPATTLYGISTGTSANPKLHTLAAVARVFNVTIGQLIGELPLNYSEIAIPIISWHDLDIKKMVINYKSNKNTNFVYSSLATKNFVFALKVNNTISDIFKNNSIIIVEATDNYLNNDLVILSINNSEPAIKKIIKEGSDIFLESVTSKLPIQQYNHNNTHIFGVIRETRF
jgi:DNA-binding XRE family transcriptional regulator